MIYAEGIEIDRHERLGWSATVKVRKDEEREATEVWVMTRTWEATAVRAAVEAVNRVIEIFPHINWWHRGKNPKVYYTPAHGTNPWSNAPEDIIEKMAEVANALGQSWHIDDATLEAYKHSVS